MRFKMNMKLTDLNSDIFRLNGSPYMNEEVYKTIETLEEDGVYISWMSPDEYIKMSSYVKTKGSKELKRERLDDDKSFEAIEKAAKKGTLTIPVIDFKYGVQNGIHRAMWCKEQGIKTIPVLVIENDVIIEYDVGEEV